MTVADLIQLLQKLDPTLRVLVADEVGYFSMHPDDVQLFETPVELRPEAVLISGFARDRIAQLRETDRLPLDVASVVAAMSRAEVEALLRDAEPLAKMLRGFQ
jgi:hypothetical protein